MRHALPYAVLWPQGSSYLGLSLTPIFALSIVTESWLGHATQKKRKKDDCTGLGSLPSEYQPNSHSFPPGTPFGKQKSVLYESIFFL